MLKIQILFQVENFYSSELSNVQFYFSNIFLKIGQNEILLRIIHFPSREK